MFSLIGACILSENVILSPQLWFGSLSTFGLLEVKGGFCEQIDGFL
jgi:hypothetical protein